MKEMIKMALVVLQLLVFTALLSQDPFGSVQPNTNLALPSSYNFQEYVFAEPDDQGNCTGATNATANIDGVFFAQTHRNELGQPFFFLIGHRPALLQLAVTGSGAAPDVQVEGFKNGQSIGTLCLKGPSNLTSSIDMSVPNFEDYFSVTLPTSWMEPGLELKVSAGEATQNLSSEELKIGPYTELNLVMYNMDVMDYNTEPPSSPIIEHFLQEVASAIPASVVRFGIFPETLKFPEVIANAGVEQVARLKSKGEKEAAGITTDGHINSIATQFTKSIHKSTQDYLSTIYFGNTLNLAPGGWGGDKSFVSFDYTDIFIHEVGHALSLPHWGNAYDKEITNDHEFLYPYGGENDDGGGRGEVWNFIQHLYEFVDPICSIEDRGVIGTETSDAMQRNNKCFEKRGDTFGPWDGFGNFSALAMHRDMIGAAEPYVGTVEYKGESKAFQFPKRTGSPILSLENGKRVYKRHPLQNQEGEWRYENNPIPGETQMEKEVYMIYGTIHEFQTQANIVYEPVKYRGTLPPIIDPTDPILFEKMKQDDIGNKYRIFSGFGSDITIKVTYEDGSVLHAVNPHQTFSRAPYTWTFGIWRNDIMNFALVVPGDKKIQKAELFKRYFFVGSSLSTNLGNINDPNQNITAENFMDDAEWLAEFEFGKIQSIGSGTIGNRVWHDLNRNGIDDFGEPGIAGVKVALWSDQDGDGDPTDLEGFVETDENGNYQFTGLTPGKYLAFIWQIDNFDEGGPLENMIPTDIYPDDPNNDINNDNNGRPGYSTHQPGQRDIGSGIIDISEDQEPLNDGDRLDDWFDYDPSGNMTIDFGFHSNDNDCPKIDAQLTGVTSLCNGTTGNIKATPASGVGPYTYNWSTGANTEEISNLTAGTYKVTIKDSNGCEGIQTIEVKTIEAIVATFEGINQLCVGETTSLTVNPTSGQAPFQFNWSTGDQTQSINNLTAGNYLVTITDTNGCVGNTNFTINALEEVKIAITGTDSLCSGALGTLTAGVITGQAPFQFNWSTGATTAQLSEVGVGSYSLGVTDDNGCMTTMSYEIFEKAAADCSMTNVEDLRAASIKIFPNPFKQVVTISVEQPDDFSVDIMSMSGQKLLSQNIPHTQNSIDLQSIATGIYIAIVRDKEGLPIKYVKLSKVF